MIRGDLVRFEERFWIVVQYDARRLRVAQLIDAQGMTQEIPHDLDVTNPEAITIVCNPSLTWPFITVPEKPRWGAVLNVYRIDRDRVLLEPFYDWLCSDSLRSGGSMFLRPELDCQVGQVIQVEYTNGRQLNVPISPGFGSVAIRKARVKAVPKPERSTSFDRLLKDDFEDLHRP